MIAFDLHAPRAYKPDHDVASSRGDDLVRCNGRPVLDQGRAQPPRLVLVERRFAGVLGRIGGKCPAIATRPPHSALRARDVCGRSYRAPAA